MLPVSGKCRRAAACLQGFEHGVDFRLAEYALLERLDIANKADALGHVGGQLGFEGAATNKGNYRMQMLRVKAQRGFHRFEVFVVLPQRVLEFEAALVELLRPLGLFFAAKNPAAHVLRFQHEDAIGREKNVVDLRGAVWGIQGDVVQAAVDLLIQLPMCE